MTNGMDSILAEVTVLAEHDAPSMIATSHKRRMPGALMPGFGLSSLPPEAIVAWAKSIAEALIYIGGVVGGVDVARRLWTHIRAGMEGQRLDASLEERLIFALTRDERAHHPFGLSLSDLHHLASSRQTAVAFRSLEARGIARPCFSQRRTMRNGRKRSEPVWFLTTVHSAYTRAPRKVFYMWTREHERPRYSRPLKPSTAAARLQTALDEVRRAFLAKVESLRRRSDRSSLLPHETHAVQLLYARAIRDAALNPFKRMSLRSPRQSTRSFQWRCRTRYNASATTTGLRCCGSWTASVATSNRSLRREQCAP